MKPSDREHVQRILERSDRRAERMKEMRERVLARGDFEVASVGERLIVAEGDSWFHFPGTDVLEVLEEGFGYSVETVAHRGDTLESMAHDERQLDGFENRLRRLKDAGRTPRAILLSGGGNDIAGAFFPIFMNHRRSGLERINEDIVRGFFDVRLRAAFLSLISKFGALCQRHFRPSDLPLPVLVHGYAHAVPDGRGFWGGWSLLPGPWLEPGFEVRGYGGDDMLPANTEVMRTLIDRFNAMVESLPEEPGFEHVRYVDLRPLLSNDPARYLDDWADELHPTSRGFAAVAGKFDEILRPIVDR
ncbi:MAG: GDSL-type esterase/lipase family protein [Acidobacteriota bacterium]